MALLADRSLTLAPYTVAIDLTAVDRHRASSGTLNYCFRGVADTTHKKSH